jgi:putative endopeptidase
MKWLPFLGALCVSSTIYAKSSEIPKRREFPLNEKVNPCENFYNYVCSNVNDSFELRPDRSSHTFSFSDSDERILEYKKEYFKNLNLVDAKDPKEKMIKEYYVSCMNEEARGKEEKSLVADQMKTIMSFSKKEEFIKWAQQNILKPEFSLVGFSTSENLDNPDVHDVILSIGLHSLPERSYYEKEELMGEFKKVVAEFFKAVDLKPYDKNAETVINFEKNLMKIYPLPREMRELWNQRNYQDKKAFVKAYPEFALSDFFKKIPAQTKFRNITPDTFKYLNQQLKDTSLEDLKIIAIYHSLENYLDVAYPDFFNKSFEFSYKFLGGPEKRPELHERCVKKISYHFRKEVDAILWPRLFPNFPSRKIVELSEKIRKSITASITKNQWLSPASKKEAMKKIKTASLFLVSPKTEEEWDFLKEMSFAKDTPIANYKKLEEALIEKSLKDLKGKVSRKRWYMGPLMVNAYYDPSANKFVMPVGILQYPFFDENAPMETNLASVGAVIGHELGHGIDDQGSKYDSSGKMREWMSTKDLEKFHSITAPFIEQFSKANHDGVLTLGENIGDLVGVTAAYDAAFLNNKSASIQLKKDFFVSYARTWCGVMRPSEREKRLKTDPHSLGEARVNEQVKHQPGFQEAYQCKDGDPMTLPSDKRLRVW